MQALPGKRTPAELPEIWEFCQSTSEVQAYVLQNLRVPPDKVPPAMYRLPEKRPPARYEVPDERPLMLKSLVSNMHLHTPSSRWAEGEHWHSN